MANKQLHPDAVYHQENLECGGDYFGDFLVIERFRTH